MSGVESMICPVCDTDIIMSGDEEKGDDVFCPTCESPLKYLINKKTDVPYLKDDN
jgi:C4-type Zn-finger protein